MSLKAYIEQNLFSEELLPDFPFLKSGWIGYIVSGDGSVIEEDFERLKVCIDQVTHDSSIKCCLTTFYTGGSGPEWVPEWETNCNWEDFIEPIDNNSAFTYSGLYFLGSSEKWGGISVDGELIVIGGETNFMRKFEEVSGGYASLKNRFDQDCLCKTYAFKEKFLIALRNMFYPDGRSPLP
jgi:hypothetical protein